MRNEHYPPEEREEIFASIDDKLLSPLRGKVCAEFSAVAEATRAQELALEETRRAIDLLRFTALLIGSDGRRIAIGIQGETPDDVRRTVAINTEDTRAHYGGTLVNYPIEIDDGVIDRMRAAGVIELSDLLKKKTLNDFQGTLLRAVHWLASAQAQYEKENALLNVVTCLEAFLKPAESDPITAAIAEGVAILTAQGVEARKAMKQRVREFYRMRSRLSHGGQGSVSDAELGEVIEIALNLTVQMIGRKDEFESQAALRSFVDDKKLAG
jgi:Apea-like HEPN